MLFPMITGIIKDGFESAFIRAIRGRPSFASFISSNPEPRTLNAEPLYPHTTAQELVFFAPMYTSVHLRAPSCGKTKKSKMVHKLHRTATRSLTWNDQNSTVADTQNFAWSCGIVLLCHFVRHGRL